jgi:hypothetical protein
MLKRKAGRSRRAKLIRDLDALASKMCKIRDGYIDQWTGRVVRDPRGCHSHHVQSRSRLDLRLDLNNLVTLSYGSHRYVHGHPQQFMTWFVEKFPKRAEYIEQKIAAGVRTIRDCELEELLVIMKGQYQQMMKAQA